MQSMDAELEDQHDDYPNRHLTWAIVTSEGVVSRMHIDTGGLATASYILEGEKWWVVGCGIPDVCRMDQSMPSCTETFTTFNPDRVTPGYHWEGISLRKNDVL